MKYIQELKNRVCLIGLCWLKTFILVYCNKEVLFFLIAKPILYNSENVFNNYFIFTKVTELFNTYIEFAFFISNQIGLFYCLYSILCYIAPALYYKEYKIFKIFVQLMVVFWFFAIIFLQNYFISIVWHFFLSFQTQIEIQFESRFSDYLEFYLKVYFMCYFQLFSITYLLIFLIYYKQTKKSISKMKKTFYFIFLIIATLMSTPELVNQFILFLVLVLFFEFITIIRLFLNRLVWKPVKT